MISIKLTFSFVFIWFLICNATAEWFTSSTQMEDLFQEEATLLNYLGHYVAYEEGRLGYLQELANEFEREVFKQSDDFEAFSRNPINQFKMFKRYAYGWKRVDEVMQDNNASLHFLWYLEGHKDYYPTLEDFNGTITGLLRIQNTYQLPTKRLADGHVGKSSSTALQAIHCYRIAEVAFDSKDYASCARWLNGAKLKLDKGDVTVRPETVLILLAHCLIADMNTDKAYEILNEISRNYPNNLDAAKLLIQIKTTHPWLSFMNIQESFEDVYKTVINEYSDINTNSFETLCQKKENKIPPNVTKSLHCYLWDNNRNPRLLLEPVKVEELWDTPHIVRFYDFISDDIIRNVTEEAIPKLHRAEVYDPYGKYSTSSKRINKSVFLEDSYPEIGKISRKIADTTGFDMGGAEALSISNYGTGGYYHTHFDCFSKTNRPSPLGNRIATVIIYFSDVEQGGHTVFIPDEITVKPIKGSAVLWFNMLTTGEHDPSTMHAGCPVMTGNKWIANKWIRQSGVDAKKHCRDPQCENPNYKMHFQ